jgi:uncharacterized protein (TIRG00374 family)
MKDEKQVPEEIFNPFRVTRVHEIFQSVRSKPLPLLLGVIISVILLWLAFQDVELADITITINDLQWGAVILALMLSIASTFARAARWRLLLEPESREVNFLHLTSVLFFSQMLNLLIPLRIGEFARILLVRSSNKALTLGSIVIEKFLDLLTLVAFLLVLPLSLSLPEWFRESSQSLILITLVVLLIIALLFLFKERLLNLLRKLIRGLPLGMSNKLEEAFSYGLSSLDIFREPWLSLRLLTWSFLIWGMGFMVNYVLFRALGLDLPVAAGLFLLLVLQVGISIPNIPGKLGVFQYATILALSVFQVEKEIALTYSLILYIIGFGPHLILGTWFGWRFWLRYRREKKS